MSRAGDVDRSKVMQSLFMGTLKQDFPDAEVEQVRREEVQVSVKTTVKFPDGSQLSWMFAGPTQQRPTQQHTIAAERGSDAADS